MDKNDNEYFFPPVSLWVGIFIAQVCLPSAVWLIFEIWNEDVEIIWKVLGSLLMLAFAFAISFAFGWRGFNRFIERLFADGIDYKRHQDTAYVVCANLFVAECFIVALLMYLFRWEWTWWLMLYAANLLGVALVTKRYTTKVIYSRLQRKTQKDQEVYDDAICRYKDYMEYKSKNGGISFGEAYHEIMISWIVSEEQKKICLQKLKDDYKMLNSEQKEADMKLFMNRVDILKDIYKERLC